MCLWIIGSLLAQDPPPAEDPEEKEEEPSGIVGTYRAAPNDPQHQSMTLEQARLIPGSLGDPIRALLNLPSMARTPLESGWLLVRGGNARDTAFYLDGMEVPSLQHLGGLTSTLHPSWFQRVDFWPGTPPVRYGDLSAGTVEVSTLESLRRPRVEAGANLGLAGGFLTLPLGPRFSMGGAFRRSYLDSVVGLVANSDAFPSFMDAQLALDMHRSRLFALGTWDKLRGSYINGDLMELRKRSLRLLGRFPLGPTEISGWVGQDQETAENLAFPDLAEVARSGGALRWERPEGRETLDWTAGVDGKLEQHRVRSNGLQRQLWIGTPALYGALRFGQQAQLRLGLRAESWWVQGQAVRLGLSPRLSGRLPLLPGLDWIGDVSLMEQLPPEDLLVLRPDGAVLELERVLGGSTGLHWKEKDFGVALDIYGKWMPRVTLFEEDGSLGQGEGLAAGLEFSAHYGGEKMELQFACSYGRNLRREQAGAELLGAATEQPFSTNLLGIWHLPYHLHLSARFRYADGLPVPPGGFEVVDLLTGERLEQPDVGRLPAFHSLDLKISTDIHVRRVTLELYLDVQNVYNRRIAEPVISTLSQTSATWVVGLPMLPILGVEGRWK